MSVLALGLSIVVGHGNDEPTFVPADCRVDIILPCSALQNCKNYTSVTWYKVSHVHIICYLPQHTLLNLSYLMNMFTCLTACLTACLLV